MRAKKKALREQKAIISVYPHYPFQDLDEPEIRSEARAYMRMRQDELPPNDESYVVRSRKIPDRRLAFPDQRLWQRLRRHAEESHEQQRTDDTIALAVPLTVGQLAIEQVNIQPEL